MNYSPFSTLWDTDSEYWAFIVLREPRFNLIVEVKDYLGNPIQEVTINLIGKINLTETTSSNGTVRFTNLSIGNYILKYYWRFQVEKDEIKLISTKKLPISLFVRPNDYSDSLKCFSSLLSLAVIIATRRSNEQNEVSHSVYF